MANKPNIGASIGLDGEKEFRQAITNINSDMKVLTSEMKKVSAEFSDNKDSVEALTAKDEVLNKQIDTQKEKVEALKNALENAKELYPENTKKINDWQVSLNNAEADLTKLENELENNKKAMEKAKNPTEELGNEVKNFGENADDAGKKTLSLGDIIKANLISEAIISGVKALGNAMLEVAGGIKDAVMNTIDYTGEISDMSQKTGVGAEELQKYAYAAKMSGMETETLEKAMIKSQTSFANAKDGSKSLQEAYEKLGININEISSSEDAFDATLKALADMGDTAEANAIASDLFGKSYAELKPLLKEGSEGIDELRQSASDLGLVMSEEAINSGEALGDTLDTIKQQASGVANTFVSMLLPGLSELATGASEYMQGFSKDIQAANGDMGKIGEVIGGALADVVNKIVEKLPEIVEGAKSIVSSLAGGIKDNLPIIIETGTEIIMNLAQSLIESLPDIITTGLNIIVSLAQGIADSLPELIPTIVDTIITIVETLIDNVNQLVDAALAIIVALADGLIEAIPKLTEKIPEIIVKLIEAISENLPKIIETGISLIIKLAEGLIKAIPDLIKSIPKIITALVKGFITYYANLFDVGKNLVKKLWEGISNLVDWIKDNAKGFGGKVISGIKAGITGLADIGLNLVKGLWEGISNATDWIVDKVKGFGSAVLNAIKGFFGIHSPSTVFKDQIGKNLALGLGEGFTETMENVSKDINDSIPTDFEINGSYNLSKSASGLNVDIYNAFAAVAMDVLVPALRNIGIVITANDKNGGLFNYIKIEADKYKKRTGLSPFPV
jgi:phage-related protein